MSETRLQAAAAADPGLLVAVDRAVAELRRGAMVVLHDGGGTAVLALSAETGSDDSVKRLLATSAAPALLVLTAERGAALGLGPGGRGVVTLTLPAALTAMALRQLADPTAPPLGSMPQDLGRSPVPAPFAGTAVELAKLARLLPAVLIGGLGSVAAADAVRWAGSHDLLCVAVDAAEAYQAAAARSLRPVGDARVPLEGAENARIVAFRPSDGGIEHLAILIGDPPPGTPVLARLHSECFTGDLLASLRCDCGDQLRGAIAEIARQGSGVLLYLAQEGRGIGLVNKLRAYRLQDSGADTLDANRQLGFDADERVYLPAAEMLRQLGYRKVRLMTNNPAKVAGLVRCGIAVVERVPHVFPSNPHNDRYLETKAARFGHLY